jgi:hypothetical protein
MITAILHYRDGSTLKREIPNVERFKTRHLDDLTGETIVGHDFAYRIGQSEYLVSVHFDEIDAGKPLAKAARTK